MNPGQSDMTVAEANSYAQAMIWQESLRGLDGLKCTAAGDWTEFLKSVGVDGAIVEASLAQCVEL